MKIKLSKALLIVALGIAVSGTSFAGKIHYYKDSGGAKYRICKDSDGFIVYKPNGGQDMHGRGYSWKDVKRQYGLGKWYKRSQKSYRNCP